MKKKNGVLGFLLLSVLAVDAQQKRPNILIILSDDHAQQTISAYGSKLAQTPNIDRIAKEGAIFTNSFVTNSICAPSRAVLLTGKYSHLNGLKDNSAQRRFDGSQQQLQKLLGAANYQTAWIGKWHLQSLPQGFNFWKILPDQGNYFQPDFINMKNDTVRYKGYVTNLISDYSIDWLNKRDASSPFFLVIGEKATHRNWMPDIQDLGAYDDKDFPLPANFYDPYTNRKAATEQDMTINKTMTLKNDLKVRPDFQDNLFGRLNAEEKQAYQKYYDRIANEYEAVKKDSNQLVKWKYERYLKDYLATARSLDRNIGRILKYLDSTGLTKNTVVIYTSDQGFYMGEHGWFDKRFMYEESLRTPFVMRYPGMVKPGTIVDKMIVNLDIAPTVLDLAKLPVPADLQGSSMVTLLRKAPLVKAWRRSLYYHYYEYPEPHRVAPHFGIRTEQYKLIRFYGPHDDWELFDIVKDPHEMKNLYHQTAYKPQIDKLTKELRVLIEKYKDTEALQILDHEKNK
jgi:arylsulfatase A-like enzyme